MTLGESISFYRKSKSLSQAQLSEVLSVSRQSVSKWETDAAVPEIDKLIRLSEIFEITVDQLVKGETQEKRENNRAPLGDSNFVQQSVIKSTAQYFPARKITGTILLCLAFLTFLVFTVIGGILSGILFSSPFLLCGIVCFVFRKNIGLWCSWAVYFAVDMYLGYGTALNRSNIFHTLSWTYEMNYAILVMSWISFLILVGLWGTTTMRIGKQQAPRKRNLTGVIISSAVIIVSKITDHLIVNSYIKTQMELKLGFGYGDWRVAMKFYRFLMFLTEWMLIIAFTTLSVYVLRLVIYAVKRKKEAKISL